MSTKSLLIVEDDEGARNLLRTILEEAGYQVALTKDGPDALRLLEQYEWPDLIILDLGLPTMGGFELCRRIKAMGDLPIIILTGEKSIEAKVHGIGEYAEDYITKPFNEQEVVVRIARVLRRLETPARKQKPRMVIDAHLTIDFPNNCVILDGALIALTPIETSLLSNLVRRQGQFVSAQMLMARVWPNEEVYEERLRVHISRLRSKLRSGAQQIDYIITERGTGYMFTAPEDQAQSKP